MSYTRNPVSSKNKSIVIDCQLWNLQSVSLILFPRSVPERKGILLVYLTSVTPLRQKCENQLMESIDEPFTKILIFHYYFFSSEENTIVFYVSKHPWGTDWKNVIS